MTGVSRQLDRLCGNFRVPQLSALQFLLQRGSLLFFRDLRKAAKWGAGRDQSAVVLIVPVALTPAQVLQSDP